MRCYSPDGDLLWHYIYDTPGEPFTGASGAVVGDLNQDNRFEIIFCTYAIANDISHLIILDDTGEEQHKVALPKRGSMSPPTLADVDRDGVTEIIVSLKDTLGAGIGGVQIWDVATAVAGPIPWSTGRGNLFRNGQMERIEAKSNVNGAIFFLLLDQ